MANPCRVVVRAQPDTAVPDPRQVTQQYTDRRFPTKLVKISGKNLDDELISGNILSLTVEETARGLSKATVVLFNPELTLTDNMLFQTGVKVELWTGYRSTPLVKRGTFYCVKPNQMFRQGAAVIELECYSEEWPLTVSERRQVYESKRDSDIATFIAQQYGLTSDVDQTDPIHEHVAQMNSTDAAFLEERARFYGYDFYISEGVLHFHAPRFTDSNISLFYGTDQVSQLAAFNVSVDPWMSGMVWTRSGIDRLSGDEWIADSTDSPDVVAQTIQNRSSTQFTPASQIATLNGVRPQRFIVGGGHEQTQDEGKQEVLGFTRSTSWIVHGTAYLAGVETIKARQLIEVVGIGHLSGYYYITKAYHKLAKGYSTRFEAIRPGIGSLLSTPGAQVGTGTGRLTPDDATSQSTVVGTATVN